MARKRKKGRSSARPQPFYDLVEVKQKIQAGKVLLRSNALDGARDAFGWDASDILSALSELQLKHFHGKDNLKFKPLIVVDSYRAYGLKGENVYTHFYINDITGLLVINSFKEI
jgi:hypothetical protein